MRVVSVNTPSAAYDVKIGSGLLDRLGEEVRAHTRAARAVVVSGEHVFPLYGSRAMESLQKAGLRAESIVFPAGEETKSLACYGELLNALTEKASGKKVIALPIEATAIGNLNVQMKVK